VRCILLNVADDGRWSVYKTARCVVMQFFVELASKKGKLRTANQLLGKAVLRIMLKTGHKAMRHIIISDSACRIQVIQPGDNIRTLSEICGLSRSLRIGDWR